MATYHYFTRYLFLFILSLSFCAPAPALAGGDCVVSCAEEFLHVREATGKNDGKEVEMFLASVGLSKGYSWCAAFVHFILKQCGIANTINAWSPTAHNARNLIYSEGKHHKEPLPGDVFTIWSVSLKRIGHTGFVHSRACERFYISIEGNTNDGGSFNGDGVYKRRRSFKQTYSISRWTS